MVLTRRVLGSITFLLTAGMLIACLWPFNPFPVNDAQWLPGGGLRFGAHGILLGSEPFSFPNSEPDGSCSLELLLRPTVSEDQNTILAISAPDDPLRFELQQYFDELLVQRTERDQQGRRRVAVLEIERVFRAGQPVLVTITSGGQGTVVYLDGRPVKSSQRYRLTGSVLAGRLVFGTSPRHSAPWRGDLLGLALYDRELKASEVAGNHQRWNGGWREDGENDRGMVALYRFSEGAGNVVRDAAGRAPNLVIPEHYILPEKPVLFLPSRSEMQRAHFWVDVALNVLGFIPFAFFACAWFAALPLKRPLLWAVAAGIGLTLGIELLQALLPLRDSDFTDLVTNTTGTLSGTGLFLLARSRLPQWFGIAPSNGQ